MLSEPIRMFLQYMTVERRSAANTIKNYGLDLAQVDRSLPAGLVQATDVDLRTLFVEFQAKGISPRTLGRKRSALKHFYRYMRRKGIVAKSPLNSKIPAPKIGRRLPKPISDEDFEKLLKACEIGTPKGLCELAILRLLDSGGLRASELIGLELPDLHLDEGYLIVHEGKGDKDRFVPIDEPATIAARSYLADGRPQMYTAALSTRKGWSKQWARKRNDSGRVFPFSRQHLWQILRDLCVRASIPRRHPHQLRHRLGTTLVKQGLELREVADILGHSSTDTTEGYVAVDLNDLRAVFQKTHPRASTP